MPGFLLLAHAPFLIGWARPVTLDYRNLRHPKRDMVLVAAAGPLSNLLLAVIFVLLLRILLFIMPAGTILHWLFLNLENGIAICLVLCIFNLLPILPLDGGRIVSSLLPVKLSIEYQKTEPYGMFVLIGLLFMPSIFGINIISWFINVLYPYFMGILRFFM